MVTSKAMTSTQPSRPIPVIQAIIDSMPPSIIVSIGQRRSGAVQLLAMLALCAPAAWAEPGPFSVVGLAGWTEQTFRGRAPTGYRLARDAGVQVLEADCRASASGWMWKEKIDLRLTPMLAWRWKVAALHPGVREREKAGDDFAARVYVVAGGGLRSRSLVYVWAGSEAQGGDWPSAYTAQAHVVALRSGTSGAQQWREERRDVRADFRRYFGLELEAVDGVAVMTDCDDAGGVSRAWYGDLRFEKPAR